jgi:hypothetical protein
MVWQWMVVAMLGFGIAARAASVAELMAKAAASEAAGLKANFMAEAVEPPAAPYALTPADQTRGAVLFHPPLAAWFTGRAPAQDEVGGAWELTVARGEIASTLLAVYAVTDRKGLFLRAGATTPEVVVETLPLVMAPMNKAKKSATTGVMGDTAGSNRFAKVGLWMADSGSVDVAKGEARAWVVRVRVGSKAAAGAIALPLELVEGDAGKAVAGTSLSLKVLPFELADPWARGHYFGAFWGGYHFPYDCSVEEFRQLREHGIDAGHCFWSGRGAKFENVNGELKVNLDALDSWVARMQEGGMRGPLVLTLGTAKTDYYLDSITQTMKISTEGDFMDVPSNRVHYISGLRQLVDHAVARKWPELVIMGPDEPTQSSRKMRRHHRIVQMIHENFPKTRVYGVCMDKLKNAEQVVDADILVCNGDHERIVALGKEKQRTVWGYGSFTTANGYDSVRRRFGIQPFTFGVTGEFFWSLGYNMGDPFNEFDDVRGDSVWNIAWPPVKKGGGRIVESVPFEGMRDGINDVRYAMTLEQLLAKRTDEKAAKVKTAYAASRATDMRKAESLPAVRAKLVEWILEASGK